MLWIAVDVLLALLAIGFLLLVLLRLWRSIKAFTRALGVAGDSVAAASDVLAAAQAEGSRRR